MRILKALARYIRIPLSLALLLSGLVMPHQAQKRVVIISAQQPNIWTLEQVHYSLAQMHQRNLDLREKGPENLNANEINEQRLEILKRLIELDATFNQADLVSQSQKINSQRRRDLTAEGDRLRKQSLTLTAEIDELETKKAEADTKEEKDHLDAKIILERKRLAKVDKELENTIAELKTLNGSTGEPKSTAESLVDKAFQDAFASQIENFNNAATLNLSARLDNYLQLQYEIIAKQLTLLRDELEPGERMLFLEMPQTLNVAHHKANKKWAQSWWKIVGYTRRESNTASTLTPELIRTVELIPRQRSLNVSDTNVRAGKFNAVVSMLFDFTSQLDSRREQFLQLIQQERYSPGFIKGSHEFGWTFTPMPGMNRLQSGLRTTYAVVIVPDNAASLILEATGCYFPSSAHHPTSFEDTKTRAWNKDGRTSRNCGGEQTKTFIVRIPVR